MKINSTKDIGKAGEEQAANFLCNSGYEVVARNYRWARGEIDIVARQNDLLIFVEVKTATNNAFGNPETWVNERKQKQIGMVAERYLQENEIVDMDCRFDVVAVSFKNKNWQIKHIENAFWL